jgi:signal transduction histidine kinase
VLARPIGGGHRRRGPPEARGGEHQPRPPAKDERTGEAPVRERPLRVLAAWASLEPVEAEIRSLAAVLPLISVGLWALAAAIGRHFARRALAPPTRMAESARTMPFDDGRLPSPGPRDELEDFARSFSLLDNLLENACKYSGPGTPIVVRTWCEPGAVVLAVEDRGCGSPAEDLPRVFEPFYRAESARRLGRAGVGLGLAVARRIAATHRGTITAESEPGGGSRFVVRLPRAPAPDVATAVVDRPEQAAPAPA